MNDDVARAPDPRGQKGGASHEYEASGEEAGPRRQNGARSEHLDRRSESSAIVDFFESNKTFLYFPMSSPSVTVPAKYGGQRTSSSGYTAECVAFVKGRTVSFLRPNVNDCIDMATSRAEVDRRFLSWFVWFPMLNGDADRSRAGRFRANRPPTIMGSQEQLRIVLLLVAIVSTLIWWPLVASFIAVALQAGQGRRRAIATARALNELGASGR